MEDIEQGEYVTATPPWSPAMQALEVMARLEKLGNPGSVHKMFDDMWDQADADLDAIAQLIFRKTEKESKEIPEFYFVCLACACCVQTIRATDRQDWGKAWIGAMDAMFWAGSAIGINLLADAARQTLAKKSSAFARRGADAAHAENRALKKLALEYFEDHRKEFPSKEQAASVIASKVVPIKVRTVRDWLTKVP